MSTDNDDLLRDALRDDAGSASAPGDAWGAVRARATTIRRRRQLTQRVTAAVATLGVVAGVVVATGALDSDAPTIATPTPTNDQIVAVQGPNNGGDRLVVLSADDGRVIRTLAEDIGITFGGISATPDGQTVYFARRRTALPCDRIEIAKVPSGGGEVEVVGAGISPLVSPDGRTLAYVRSPADDPCGPNSEIVRLSLVSGEESVFAVNEVRDGVASPRVPVSWSPDGASWLVATCCADQWWSGVAVEPVGNPGGTRFLDLPTPADGATYLPDGRALVALEDSVPPDGAQLHRLVTFDPETGAQLETIFESRQNGVLHITANASGEMLMHFGGNLVQRWRPGQAEPTTIAEDIREAAWLPRSVEPTPDSTTTTTAAALTVQGPERLVVARSDRQLDVMAGDGTVIRSIGTASLDYQNVALAPDGVTLYYEQGAGGCAEGEIGRVRIGEAPLTFEFLTMGTSMALSPDGTKLAYRRGECGGELVVRNTETGGERYYSLADPADGGPIPEHVGPVGWDADNQHVMLKVNREPTTEFWYVDTEVDDHEVRGPAYGPKGEQGLETGPSKLAPLGTTGKWAAVYANVGGPSLVEYDLASGSVVRPLAELPTTDTIIVGSDPTGQHVLLLVPNGGGHDLWRWSAGDAVATLLVEGVVAADW